MLSHSRLCRSFIERPKLLDCQSATWSDYKYHNTIQFLDGAFKFMPWWPSN